MILTSSSGTEAIEARAISGTQMAMAPVAGMPQTASEPWPSCHTSTSTL